MARSSFTGFAQGRLRSPDSHLVQIPRYVVLVTCGRIRPGTRPVGIALATLRLPALLRGVGLFLLQKQAYPLEFMRGSASHSSRMVAHSSAG
ncbi:hypothetical protein OKW41_004455 [Paraburkholderia sp. UCT70]